MKKKIIGMAGPVALAVLTGLSSCGGNNADRLDVSYEVYEYRSVAERVGGDTLDIGSTALLWRCVAEGVLPQKIGKLDVTALRDTLMALGAVETDGAKARARLPEGYRTSDAHPDSVQSVVANNLSVVLVSPRVMVWRCYHYAYPAGAAHGTYSDTYVNFSTEGEGKVLTLVDIFQSGARQRLLEMVRSLLSDREDLIVELDEVQLPQNFRVTEDGVTFVYGLYEVAPYSSGEVEVALNSYAVADMLTPWAVKSLFAME